LEEILEQIADGLLPVRHELDADDPAAGRDLRPSLR